MIEEGRNFSDQCVWFRGGENRSEARLSVSGHLDVGGCLFLSILPRGEATSVLVCIFVALTLLSLLINGFTLFGLMLSEELSWQPRFALLKNLIYSDLIQTVTIGPSVIYSLVQRRTMNFNAWCYMQYVSGTVSVFCSLFTLTSMAFERYLYVCHAIRYLAILTPLRLRLAVSVTWGFSVAIGFTNVVLVNTGGQEVVMEAHVTTGLLCEPDTMDRHMGFPRAAAVFRKLTGSLVLLACLLVYAFSYVRMYQDARKAVLPFNVVNTKARGTVMFYCGMLLLQLLPIFLKVVSDALWELGGTGAMVSPWHSLPINNSATASPGNLHPSTPPSLSAAMLHMSLLVMLIFPPCINPLIFGLRNPEVRRALPGFFWRKKDAVGRVISPQPTSVVVRPAVCLQDRPNVHQAQVNGEERGGTKTFLISPCEDERVEDTNRECQDKRQGPSFIKPDQMRS